MIDVGRRSRTRWVRRSYRSNRGRPQAHSPRFLALALVAGVVLVAAASCAADSPGSDSRGSAASATPDATTRGAPGADNAPPTSTHFGTPVAAPFLRAEPEPPVSTVPDGWQVLDWADFRFAVPAGWVMPVSRSCLRPPPAPDADIGFVLVREHPNGQEDCTRRSERSPDPIAALVIEGSTPLPAGRRSIAEPGSSAPPLLDRCNGCPTRLLDGGFVTTARGNDAVRALATIGPSGRSRALLDGPVLDVTGWQTIRADGVTLRAPETWPIVDIPRSVTTNVIPGGFQSSGVSNPGRCGGLTFPAEHNPEVVLGIRADVATCGGGSVRVDRRSGDGVWVYVRGAPAAGPTFPEDVKASARVGDAEVFLVDRGEAAIRIEVNRNGRYTYVTIGVGPDPAVARTVLRSLALD